jgi:thiol-disulfide isomerase/thioredoxin
MPRLLAILLLCLAALQARALELTAGSGEPLPALRFNDLQGNELGLEDFRGRVVVLNLWATWCAPCREEMPALDRLQAMLDPAEAVVVGLSVDRAGPDRVKAFVEEIGVARMTIVHDPKAQAARQLKVPGLPATILVDRDSREAGRLYGIAEWDSPEALAVVKALVDREGA